MTGYEIYDEGYEAGYESAMEDLMEAMEYTGDPEKMLETMKRRIAKGSDHEQGRAVGRAIAKQRAAQNAFDNTNKFKDALNYQRKMNKAADEYDDLMRKRANKMNCYSYDDDVRARKEKDFDDGVAFGANHYNKKYKRVNKPTKVNVRKKANEALFDFDDIDHTYLDDEYDDFDYE